MDNENNTLPTGGEDSRPAEGGRPAGSRRSRNNRRRGRSHGGNGPDENRQRGQETEAGAAAEKPSENPPEGGSALRADRLPRANQNNRRRNNDNRNNDKRNGDNRQGGENRPAADAAPAERTAADRGAGAAETPAAASHEVRSVWSSGKKRPQRPMMPAGSASGASVSNTRPIPSSLGNTRPLQPVKPADASAGTEDTAKAQPKGGDKPFPRAERNPERNADKPADRAGEKQNDRAGDKQNDRQAAEKTGDSPAQPSRVPGQRPPRNPRRASRPAELPQMDNLLIEDVPAEDTSAAVSDTDPAELERILAAEICTPQSRKIPDVIPEGKVVIVGVRFRAGGKTYFFDPGKTVCQMGRSAIVETARGLEFGEICIPNRMVDAGLVVPPLRPLVRLATEEDVRHNKENHEREDAAYRIGVEKINAHKLDMKLVAVQYTFDNSKLLFYFTSAGRVDFRELVKDLAGVFHIRIELRQIGIRDEARMIGGLGTCGRPLCCATFLSDFGQVSMKMAKEQNLSLNSSKISGCCGRLLCCLRYEYETYVEEAKRTPSAGTFVNTPEGPGVVTEAMPLLGEVKVSLRNAPDTAPKKFKREEVTLQSAARPGAQTRGDRPAVSAEAAPAVPADTDADAEPDSSI